VTNVVRVRVMRLLSFVSLAVFWLVASSCLLSSQQPEQGGQAAAATIKARAELVVVPVVVTDKSGNHVSGLKHQDFIVQENDVEQKIAFFEEVTTNTEHVARTKPGDNSFSNILQAGKTPKRVTILLFDLLNTRSVDQKRDAMMQSLSESLDVTEPTALYILTRSGLKPIHDFTTDPKVLIAAIKKMRGSTDADLNAATDAPDLLAASSEAQDLLHTLHDATENCIQRRIAAETTLEAMQQLAKAYAGLPGRKAIIWATGGFPFRINHRSMELAPRESYADVAPLYERTWKAINDANFAIYPIDLKGLNQPAQCDPQLKATRPQTDKSREHAQSANGEAVMNCSPAVAWATMESQATMQVFANATGGTYYNRNDLVKGFREAAKDSRTYYLLSYYLNRGNAKPGWRKLHVKLDRRGVKVRARSGFFVTDAASSPISTDTEVMAAVNSPLDYTELPLKLTWTNFGALQNSNKREIEYEVYIPANATTVDEGDSNHLRVAFIAQVRLPDGKIAVQPQARTFEGHLKPEALQKVRSAGLRYRNSLELPAGDYTVRFVALDSLSGKMGSVAATLKVEKLKD